MKNISPLYLFALLIVGLGSSSYSYADGLADLKEALAKLQGNNQISALLQSNIIENRGEGKDKVVKNGFVEINLKDGLDGLQVTFSNQVLNKVDIEASEKIKNEDADTPTLTAVDRLETTELKAYLSSAQPLLRRLEQATYIDEQAVDYQGSKARLLNFELPMHAIVRDKQTREYVSKFEGNFQIIIDDKGVPLETQLNFKGKGRAYIVLSLKAYGNGLTKYKVVEERLVTVHREFTSGFESTFGERETIERIALTL